VGYRSRALPRGAVTVIIDVGRRQQLDFYASDGQTKLTVWLRTGRKFLKHEALTVPRRRFG
jgi:hypothetical protein